MYTEQDFQWLNEYVAQFTRIIVTPQVLAEAWNFLEKIREKEFKLFLVKAMELLYLIDEDYNHKDELLGRAEFEYVGVTDASVIHTAQKLKCLVITDDLRAFSHFTKNNVATININHLRQI